MKRKSKKRTVASYRAASMKGHRSKKKMLRTTRSIDLIPKVIFK